MTQPSLPTDREFADLIHMQYQVSGTIYGSQDPAEMLEALAKFAGEQYTYGELLLCNLEDRDTFQIVAEFREGKTYNVERACRLSELPASDSLTAVELLSIPNVETDQFLEPSEKATLQAKGISALLIVPMIAGQRLIGLLLLAHDMPLESPPTRLRSLRSLVDQAAIIFDNRRLVLEAQASANELARQVSVLEIISRLALGASRFLNERELIDYVVASLGKLNLADHVGVVMLEGDGEYGVVVSEYPETVGAVGARLSMRDNPLMEQAMKNPTEPFIIEHAQTNPLQPDDVKALFKQLGIHGLMIIPLIAGGKLIGSFGFDLYEEEKTFSQETIEVARALGTQFTISLQNIRLFTDARQRANQLQRIARNEAMINYITERYRRGATLEDMLAVTIQELGLALGARRARIRLESPLREVTYE